MRQGSDWATGIYNRWISNDDRSMAAAVSFRNLDEVLSVLYPSCPDMYLRLRVLRVMTLLGTRNTCLHLAISFDLEARELEGRVVLSYGGLHRRAVPSGYLF